MSMGVGFIKRSKRGVAMVEYVVLIVVLAVSVPIIATQLGPGLAERFCEAREAFGGPSCSAPDLSVIDVAVTTVKGVPVEIDLLAGATVSVVRSQPLHSGVAFARSGARDEVRIARLTPLALNHVESARALDNLGVGRLDPAASGDGVVFDPLSDFDDLRSDEFVRVVFDFTVAGPGGVEASARATVTVLGFHAEDDEIRGFPLAPIHIDGTLNDHIPGRRDEIAIVSVTQPSLGSVRIENDLVVFDPGEDFTHLAPGDSVPVNFTYTIEGPMGALTSAEVTVRVEPLAPDEDMDYVKVVSGFLHACAIGVDRHLYCWGSGIYGLRADGESMNTAAPRRVLGPGGVGFLTGVQDVAMGSSHVCALTRQNDQTQVYCWGSSNSLGQVGDNTSTWRPFPTRVLGPDGVGFLTNATTLFASNDTTCALTNDRYALCWGGETLPTNLSRWVPRYVRGWGGSGRLQLVDHIAIGGGHGCMIHGTMLPDHPGAAAPVACWGWNTNHALGHGHNRNHVTTFYSFPVPVMAPFSHDLRYPLGRHMVLPEPMPVFGGGRTPRRVATTHDSSCVLDSHDTVWCWGRGNRGQLGIGDALGTQWAGGNCPMGSIYTHTNIPMCGIFQCDYGVTPGSAVDSSTACLRHYPVQVLLPAAPIVDIVATHMLDSAMCANYADGRLFCWGDNRYGHFATTANGTTGTGTFLSWIYHHTPTPATTLPPGGFRQIALGGRMACGLNPAGLRTTGRAPLSCWGTIFPGNRRTNVPEVVPQAIRS